MSFAYSLLFTSVFLTAFSQILLKLSAMDKLAERKLPILKNPKTYTAYALLFIALGMNVYGLRFVPLSHMAFILPVTFILVPVLSRLILDEHLSRRYWHGTILIIAGVIIFNLTTTF